MLQIDLRLWRLEFFSMPALSKIPAWRRGGLFYTCSWSKLLCFFCHNIVSVLVGIVRLNNTTHRCTCVPARRRVIKLHWYTCDSAKCQVLKPHRYAWGRARCEAASLPLDLFFSVNTMKLQSTVRVPYWDTVQDLKKLYVDWAVLTLSDRMHLGYPANSVTVTDRTCRE